MIFDPQTFRPRNSLVLCRLQLKSEEKVGLLTIPSGGDIYAQAEILAVGPDPVSAEGGTPGTFDLHPGQVVLVQHMQKKPGPAGGYRLVPDGIKFRHQDDPTGELYLFEQMNILAILKDAAVPNTPFDHGD